jgi:hypothetical protein
MQADSHRIKWFFWIDALEAQAGMVGIFSPKTVGFHGALAYRTGQLEARQ